MADFIIDNTDDVIFATKRWMEDTTNVKHLIDNERFNFIDCDLIDGLSVQKAVEMSKPTTWNFFNLSVNGFTFNLSSVSKVSTS